MIGVEWVGVGNGKHLVEDYAHDFYCFSFHYNVWLVSVA